MRANLVEQFQTNLKKQGRALGTIKGYVNDLGIFAEWLEYSTGQPFSPESVVPLDIRSYRGHLQTVKGLAPSTINRRLQAIRSFFRWARTAGLVQQDPAAEVQPVATTRRQFSPKSLSRQQIHRLLRAAQWSRHPQRDYAILQTMLQAGLRLSEVANLRLDDVELGPRSGKLRVRSGKGGKERAVPLNSTARKALQAYLEVRPDRRDVPQVFLSQKGGAMTPRATGRVVEVCVREAGLEGQGITAHTLRHTFATRYLDQNPGQLVELAALLGHGDLNTTAIYVQPSFEDVARKLEASPLNVDG